MTRRGSAALRGLPVAAVIAGAAMVGSSHPGTASVTSCGSAAGALQTTTPSYAIGLSVGPPETMYSRSEVAAKHPTSGEVMLGGTMSDVPGPPAPVRHLEVHICSRSTGAVVQNANPMITLTDSAPGSKPQPLPVAVMQGVNQGTSDTHYGNNVLLPSDHTYVVTIAQAADRAAFEFTLGPDGIVWGRPTEAAAAAAAPAPAPPATSAQGPGAMGSMGSAAAPHAMGGLAPVAPPQAAPPAPSTPPGTGAPTPRTGVLDDAAPLGGLAVACLGALVCVRSRRRR